MKYIQEYDENHKTGLIIKTQLLVASNALIHYQPYFHTN